MGKIETQTFLSHFTLRNRYSINLETRLGVMGYFGDVGDYYCKVI